MNVIGRFRRRMLETRGQRVDGVVCSACTKATGKLAELRRTRVLHNGLMIPGVQCPRCLQSWVEQEEKDQPMVTLP